ncbi:MAG: rod shape-determining protein MreC [Actinomycetota bacterium]|nr:rod shape-determining protein MreC [Actinomycetota bacterium]
MFSSLSRRRVLALVVITCLLLITLDKRGNPIIDRARSVFATLLSPLDTSTRAIALPIERAWYGISNYDDLERENQALRDQLQTLRGTDVEARAAILEYRELLRVNQLSSTYTIEPLAAKVVGGAPSNFQNTVEIDVGSNKGVRVGMPVTDGAGLIGRITSVSPEHSIVLLITAPEYAILAQVLSTDEQIAAEQPTSSTSPSGIPVSDLTSSTSTSTTSTTSTTVAGEAQPGSSTTTSSTTSVVANTTTTLLEVVRETGVMEGQGPTRPLLLRFTDSVSSVTGVRVGAFVETAGGNNSLAPAGIPIGRITAVRQQSGNSSAIVEITPNANLSRLFFVNVVLYVPNPDAVGK